MDCLIFLIYLILGLNNIQLRNDLFSEIFILQIHIKRNKYKIINIVLNKL